MSDIIKACFWGDLSEVENLVRDGANINITDSRGHTALMESLRYRNWSIREGFQKNKMKFSTKWLTPPSPP